MRTCVVTGSGGLVGSEAVRFFAGKFDRVIGIDNDMRSFFFGEEASVSNSVEELKKIPNYVHHVADIRCFESVRAIFTQSLGHPDNSIDLVIHAAAQPSHDWAAKDPLLDFEVNANGTLNMLELTRLYCRDASFIFTSTNKVYGDKPNKLNLIEEDKRYEHYRRISEPWEPYYQSKPKYVRGCIDENMSIDNCKHSVFGASKVAADIMVQEYGKYFHMNTVCFRGGCLTGPNHQGAELHGFLSYLVKCIVHDKPYVIHGYKGKQVRDNIHSSDLVKMFWEYHQKPRPGEVYNAGGGTENTISMLEAIDLTNRLLKKEWKNYTISEENREGDHMWYVSDLTKFKSHYPKWEGVTVSIEDIISQIIDKELQ